MTQPEKATQGPSITPGDIEANISSEFYFTAAEGVHGAHDVAHRYFGSEIARTDDLMGDGAANPPPALRLLTLCVLVLRNGFTVVGKSACASPENFNADKGRELARADAVRQIWPLMGYELRSKLAQPEPTEHDMRMAFKRMPMTLIAELVAEDAGLLGLVDGERYKDISTTLADLPDDTPRHPLFTSRKQGGAA